MKFLQLSAIAILVIGGLSWSINSNFSKTEKEPVKQLASIHTNQVENITAQAMLANPCNLDFGSIQITMGTFTECGAPDRITFSANVDTLSDFQTTINLPSEFIYKGNLSGANLISTSPVLIQPILNNQGINFSFDLQAQCSASDNGQLAFLFEYTGGNSNCSEMSLPIPVRDITVLIAPEGTPGRNTESVLNAVLNQNDTLISTVTQEGVGVIDSLFYYVDNHPLMSLEKVMSCATGVELEVAFTIGNRNYYWIGENETNIDGNDGLMRNEGIDICEVWKVIVCPELSIPPITHGVITSCALDPNMEICEVDEKTAALDFLGKVPRVVHEIDNTIAYDPTCIGAGAIKQAWILVNEGTAPAGNMDVYLTEFSGNTPIDATSFTYRIGNNSSAIPLPSNQITNRYSGGITTCTNTNYGNSADLNTRMTVNFDNTNLAPGDTLYFDYLVYPVPCNCSSCGIPRRLGTDIADMNIYTLCEDLAQNEILRSNIIWPYFDVDISSFMETPVTNTSGVVSTFSNTISNYNNTFLTNQGYHSQDDDERNEVYFSQGGGCSDCYFEAIYVLPNGLDWIGSVPTDVIWRDDDGTIWNPTEVNYTDHNGGPDTLIAKWTGQEPSTFDVFNESSGIFFEYTTDCDLELEKGICTPRIYTDQITRTFNWSSGNCPTCPKETIECEEPITVVMKCPAIGGVGCHCEGFVQTYGIAERKNLYEPDPDNNGQPDEGASYNETILRRDRFLKGDSIEVKMGGYVSASGAPFSNFDYIYAIVDFPNAEFLPIGGTVTIFESGGGNYTCDVLTQQIFGTNKLVTDLSIDRLVGNACVMPSTYEDMDSIALTFYYTTTETFVGEIQQLTYRTRFFASDEPYGGAEYSCSLPIDYRITQIGTQTSFDYYNSNLNGFEGCERGTPYYRGYSRIGSRSIDFFPGEYVGNVEFINQFQSNIPEGLVFDFFRIYIRRKNASSTSGLGSRIAGFPTHSDLRTPHPAITIVGNQLYFDMAAYLQAQTGSTDFPFSDEGYSWSLQPYFIANCNLEEGAVENASMTATHTTNEKLFNKIGYTFEDTRTDLRYDGGAEIIVEAVDGNISIDQFPTCAKIRVTNNGNAVANNTWLSLNNNSGKLIIKSLTDITGGINTPIPVGNFGLYELGDFGQNAHKLYEICVFANVCGTDSLNLVSGYDCSDYPTTIESALCSSEDVITFNSVAGNLSMIAKSPEAEVILDHLCDTVTYVVDLNAAGPGYLHDVKVDIQLPLDVDIVPGSFEIAYPTTATSTTIPPDSEFEPATDATYLYGKTYQFDVSGNDPVLATDGLIGSAGSAFNSNVVNFRFKAATTCGYGSGSRIFFEANGTEGCGNPLESIQLDFSEKVKIFGAPEPFVSDIEALPDTLSACGGGTTTLEINYGINGLEGTLNEDSIRVILPPGIQYIPNSYNQGTNPFPDEPYVTTNSGLQVLYWGISGINPGNAASFSIGIEAVDIGQTCKDYQFIVQTFRAGESLCSATGEICGLRSISDEETKRIYISKPILHLEAIAARSMSAGEDEMVMVDFEISNLGAVETSPGNVVVVDLYADIDKNGRIDKTVDLYLSTIDIDLTLSPGESKIVEGLSTIPAEYTCGFLAILDVTKNCICSQVTTGVITTDLDLKLSDDIMVCSNELQSIGPMNSNYTYEWISLDGSDLSAISPNATTSPATFQYDNNTGQAIVWNYGLSVVRASGCYTFDTIQVTIYPETTGNLATTICAPIPGCGEGTSGFQLSGPIAGTNFQWTVQSGDNSAMFEDATNPLTKVTNTISTTTTFLLTYADENGCPAEFLQTVSLLNCACTALGDTVWLDLNVNGLQDPTEPGIPGITVFLYQSNNLNTPIQTTTTNAAGFYSFQPLNSGNYVVRFDTLGQTSAYHLLVPTKKDIGDDQLDSDADSLTGFTGAYFIPNGISDTTVDAGFYPAFDLALKKEINITKSPGPYFAGDTIAYTLTIVNQGGYYPATNIEITDYIPTDMEYVDAAMGSLVSKNGQTIQLTNLGGGQFQLDQLPILDEVEFDLQLKIKSNSVEKAFTNFAEISDYNNAFNLRDIDSQADNMADNDGGGIANSPADNFLNGNGSGEINSREAATDEDDHDPAFLAIQTVDLALVKKVDDTFNAQPIALGELFKFNIIVINQGEIAVDSVKIRDYVPIGLGFDPTEPLNMANGWQADSTTTLKNRILPGERDTIAIYLTALPVQNSTEYINASEILAAYDTITGRNIASFDIDSSPGSNTSQENGIPPGSLGDNDISSTGLNDVGSEDDHDIAIVEVVYPDVALQKIITPSFDLNNLKYSEPVPFDITVFNQGTMDADTLKVIDYLPEALQFDGSLVGNNGWTKLNDSTVITSIPNVLATAKKTVRIWLKPLPSTALADWVNQAEIYQFIDKKGIDRSSEDIDSQLDSDRNNNRGGAANSLADNAIDGNGLGIVGGTDAATDQDNADPALLAFLDLALIKQLVTPPPYKYGDTLTYKISVYNQGSLPTTNIIITDSFPSGLTNTPTLNTPFWIPNGNQITATIKDTLLFGDSTSIFVKAILTENTGGINAFTNISEILSAQDTLGNIRKDLDSDADSDTQNDAGGIPNSPTDDIINGDGIIDEDDHDPAIIEVFDLALRKTTEMMEPMMYGDTVLFDFTVYNQGNIAAKNIEITDYIPCGFEFRKSFNLDWEEVNDSMATYVITDTLAAGDSTKVEIQLVVQPCFTKGAWRNKGEISKTQDYRGTDFSDKDIDSQTDSLVENDGVMLNNEIHNAGQDEDDSDYEEIVTYDLAQIKQLITLAPYAYGDTLNYQIKVYNQGNVAATNIEITDSIPVGLEFITDLNLKWAGSGASVSTTIKDTLQHTDSLTLNIQLRLIHSLGGAGNYTNISEISSSEDDKGNNTNAKDLDSTPDKLATNDAGGIPNSSTDDIINGDGIIDEDDHDPAIIEVFDLALRKTTEMMEPMMYGDTISFDFTVYNQGNIAAKNIEITDYLPCGFEFRKSLNLDWEEVNDSMTTYVITDTLAVGDSTKVEIQLVVQPCFTIGAWRNKGEISKTQDYRGADFSAKDIDSQADSLEANDVVMLNNEIHNAGQDEDDSDYEEIVTYDLAQIKQLLTPAPYTYGDTLNYEIKVYNQGNIAATNIEITDSIPAGLVLIEDLNLEWGGSGTSVSTTITDTLQHADSASIFIQLRLINTLGGVGNYTNISEISNCEDFLGNNTNLVDFDSDPDKLATNDAGGLANTTTDDITHGDGVFDEDDHDPAMVEIFDLALRKTSRDTYPYAYEDTLTFDLTIYNQGSVFAKNIEISDYLPTGYEYLALNDENWNFDASTRIATRTIPDILPPGDSLQIHLSVLIIPAGGVNAWKNIAEISYATDTLNSEVKDIDSTLDSIAINDGNMLDNEIHNAEMDEDDSDFHDIEIYDLALFKTLMPTQPKPIFSNDMVTFELYVVNQGNIKAYDILIQDYLPPPLLFILTKNLKTITKNKEDWTLVNETPMYEVDELMPLDTAKVIIRLQVNPAFVGGSIFNYAEINFSSEEVGGENAYDIDSKADDLQQNDVGGIINTNSDNHIEDDGKDGDKNGVIDEDDHDPAYIFTMAAYPRIVNPCECIGNGLFKDEVTIFTTRREEIWSLVESNGGVTNNLTNLPIPSTAQLIGEVDGFFLHQLTVYHESEIGYTSKLTNGKISFNVNNTCYEDFACRVIIPPTDSTSTPGPPIPICTNLINVSNVPAMDTLADCNGCEFRSEGAEDAILYRDTTARNNVSTIYPQNAWQTLSIDFVRFDLAVGDTLYVFDGPDTLSNLLGKYSGTGVSQTGGRLSASCQPAINPLGCLTFQFKTNGDNRKGTGWVANTTCEEEDLTLTPPNNLGAKLTCSETYRIFTIEPATVTANCTAIQDSQFVRIYDAQGKICRDTLIAFDKNFKDTFAIGAYLVEYKLKTDTVKTAKAVLIVQAPLLVCNDEINLPIGTGCSIRLTPDDLLENPCDTISDTLYYVITINGKDKNGNEIILATGGGKGGEYPIITKDMIDHCGGSVTAEIERQYYKELDVSFCNNGLQKISCRAKVNMIDQSPPIFTNLLPVDTFVTCNLDLSQLELDLVRPIAIDNCDSVKVDFMVANIISLGNTACDTTKVEIIWSAADECGNATTATQNVIFVRPTLNDIVKTGIHSVSCDGNEDGTAIITEIPSIKIGRLKNGVLVPSDTIELSTQEYRCGYILESRDVFIPSTDCGKKIYRYWTILDWCDATNGPQPIDTTAIEFTDTQAPAFVEEAGTTAIIELDHFACTYDISKLGVPAATDNCSTPTIRLNKVSRVENGEAWEIPTEEWTSLNSDSFKLEWIAEDICHEQFINDTLNQIILIKDVTKPSVVCTDNINLSIGKDYARLHYRDIDGGSSDACGIAKYEVSRDEIKWDSIVTFTCEDAHQATKVYLKVTDKKGNQNTCWMTVNVEDKIAPICSDLPDRMESCEEVLHLASGLLPTDVNGNGQMDEAEWVDLTVEEASAFNTKYGNPVCSDNINCGALIIEQQYQKIEKTCGEATIKRRFRAIDWDGEGRASNWASQTINIEYKADWSITLPADWKGECGATVPTSEVLITNGACDLIAYQVEEKVYSPSGAGGEDACLKVVRTFTIINWCKYEAGGETVTISRTENEQGVVPNAQTITSENYKNAGKLEYVQILKLKDETAPIIITQEVDDCISTDNCLAERTFSITATDCNEQSTATLKYNWRLYQFQTEELIAQGTGASFTRMVSPSDRFVIKWEVADNCGNVARATDNHYFVDCQKPAPSCIHGVAVELMPDVGTVQIWASDIDASSTDNCTAKDKLETRIWHESLGEAPTHIASIHALPENITFNCTYLGNQTVRLYVIDEANNWDFCTSYVNVQDNMDACESGEAPEGMALVSGTIMDWKSRTVERVMVHAEKATTNANNYETKEDGHYGFELAMYDNYTIRPEKNDQPLNGVSTFDLVLMAKHILGITEFTNPYQMIAADVNSSGTITAFDMVQIRQLILNIKTEFSNSPSWKFVEGDYEFITDTPMSEGYPSVTQVSDLRHDMEADFVAIKIGDVSGNARPSSLVEAESRTTKGIFEITAEDKDLKAGETYSITFSTKQLAEIQGYQFTLGYENLKIEKLQSGAVGVENFGLHKMDEGIITTSWNEQQSAVGSQQLAVNNKATGQQGNKATELFILEFTAIRDGELSKQLSLLGRPTVIEAYNENGELMDVKLTFTTPVYNDQFELFQNQPNPFQDKTLIGFYLPGDSEVQLILRDETGRVLMTLKEDRKVGYNLIQLDREALTNGFIYYQLSTKFGVRAKKMIVTR